ncbi:MAG TPA: ferredoxin [Candidatus Saccharimonadales bacterium]|nr:ferredoxin [Candidatus Saccharimonadales bacterium]
MAKRWKITIDRDLCIGAGSCVALAMSTFALDSENKAIVLEGEGDPPDVVKLAAESCPTKAIILYDDETGEQEYP